MSSLGIAIASQQMQNALLLLQYDCDINPSFPVYPPLFLAIRFREHELIKRLLSKGARINAVDNIGMGILHYAGLFGHHEALLILLEHDPMIADVILVDDEGRTPMQCFEFYRKMMVPEDEELYAKSKKVFEAL